MVANAHPARVRAPPGWLAGYETFVSRNAGAVGQIETALRSLTYIVPGRFRDSELATESLHAAIQLLSLYHDSLLARVFARLPSSIPRPLPSAHTRYTTFWTATSPLYRRLAQLVQMIQYTELLWEMVARRRGERARWRVVVLLESIKAICRLWIWRLTRLRPVSSSPLPQRPTDPRSPPEASSSTAQQSQAMAETPDDMLQASLEESLITAWPMPRSGLGLPDLPEPRDVTGSLLRRALRPEDVKTPAHLLRRLDSKRAQIAELLWILRPLVYAMLLQRYRQNRRSWTPWVAGVSMEVAAQYLSQSGSIPSGFNAGATTTPTHLERDERQSRGWSMGWWALRGAFYQHVTRSMVQGVARRLQGKPLLGMVGDIIEDYDHLWDNYYFSTASM